MGIIDTIISNLQPDSPPKVSLYFKSPEDEKTFRQLLSTVENPKADLEAKLETTPKGYKLRVRPKNVTEFKSQVASVGLMSDPYVQSVVDTLDKSANNYLEFRHE